MYVSRLSRHSKKKKTQQSSPLSCVSVLSRVFLCVFIPSFLPPVLAAAVTQASLRSVLHKLLAAGPAFNVSALLSAAQHSNQGMVSFAAVSRPPRRLRIRFQKRKVCVKVRGSLLFNTLLLCRFWFQPSTPVSPRSQWRQIRHPHTHTSRRGTARPRTARSPFWACISAASHPHKLEYVASGVAATSCSTCRLFSLHFPLQGGMPSGKQGSASLCQTTEKRPEDPRTLQRRYKPQLLKTLLVILEANFTYVVQKRFCNPISYSLEMHFLWRLTHSL